MLTGFGVKANKAFTLSGTTYRPGDPVDASKLPEGKVKQLLAQRYLRPDVPDMDNIDK